MKDNPSYITNCFIAISQFINTLLFGYPDEMLSARAYRNCKDIRWYTVMVLLDTYFFWQKDHCKECYQWELRRSDQPVEYRRK